MGLFDRLLGKSSNTASKPPAAPQMGSPETVDTPDSPAATAGKVMPRLVEAREKLEVKDLPGALLIYEEVLAGAGERADVLVTISGDLGVCGYMREITELVGPRYDAEKHGPATGLNLLQAYLALRNADAAQHVLDILFALKRPDLEDRLFGFSNAIADLMASGLQVEGNAPADAAEDPAAATPDVKLVTISKPIWAYGLETLADLLPAKSGKLRRVAFAQLALPGVQKFGELAKQPEEEMGRLCRALPLWLAETFYFSPHYAPIAAIGVHGQPGAPGHYALFGAEWSTDNLRQLVDTAGEGLDYIFTGAIRQSAGDYELVLRVWEVRKFRERKQFTARWTPATADVELAKLHEQIRGFMEWSADPSALAYVPPASPRAWLETLGASVTLFLADKTLLAKEQVPALTTAYALTGEQAATQEAAALAYLTLTSRATQLELSSLPPDLPLIETAKVAAAREALGVL
jgi:hypothetical protein